MRGNCRTSGTLRKEEGGNVFGLGSRTPIALTLLVKKPTTEQQKAKIYYHEIGSFLTREQKLAELKRLGSVLNEQLTLSSITPSKDHDWINKRSDIFEYLVPIEPDEKFCENAHSIFRVNSRGLETARDVWVYNSSEEVVRAQAKCMVDTYNTEVSRYIECNEKDEKILFDSTKISWSSSLMTCLKKREYIEFNVSAFRVALYRPFFKQKLYFGPRLIHRRGQWDFLFPDPQSKNLVLCVPGIGVTKDFSVMMVDIIPDLELIGKSQCFPLYYYEKNDSQQSDLYTSSQGQYIRHDGISDFALNLARELNPKITKEDIFYYIYGFLHNPEYRTRFAADLKKSLPRIFFPATYEEFKKYCEAGRHLAKLHLNYESGHLCPSVVVSGCEHGNFKVDKMRFLAKDDKRTIIFNNDITIENIPQEAYNYVINGKSAIEWIMERYAVTIDKNSKIVNDPNQWSENPRYVLDLLLRIIQMSLETLKIVNKLPKLNLPN